MAGRHLFQKLVSRTSRSTSLLGAQASAPVTCRASEGGVRTLTNFSHGPPAHPTTVVPTNAGIHGYPARYLSTFHCSRAISGSMKPVLVDYVRARRIFSSSPSGKDWEHKLSTWEAERKAKWEAGRAADKAALAAWNAKMDAKIAAYSRFIGILSSSWCLLFVHWWYSPGRTSNCEGQRSSHCCCCCKCQTGCSESSC